MSYVDCYLLNVSALQITYFFYTMFYIYSHILGIFHFVIDIDSHHSVICCSLLVTFDEQTVNFRLPAAY